jgi:hypothetical protein
MSRNRVCPFATLILLGICHLSFAQDRQPSDEVFQYTAQDRRNPFHPLVASDGRMLQLDRQPDLAAFSLQGIIYDAEGYSYALVNGEVVKVGDIIGGYQIWKIEEKKIILRKDGQKSEIKLEQEEE